MKKLVLFLISFFVSLELFGQSADYITKVLSTDKATFGQLCYLSATCQSLVKDNASEVEAVNAIFEQGKISVKKNPDDFVTYKDVAYVFAKLWNVKGGLLFTVTGKNPRYSFKKLKSDGVISKKADPSFIPSGVDMLNIYTMGNYKYVEDK